MTKGVPNRKIRVASIPLSPPGGAVPSMPSSVHAGLTVGVGVGVAVAVAVTVGVAEGVALGVTVGVDVGVALAVVVEVAVGVGVGVKPDCAQYLPPEFKSLPGSLYPPQTIISLPVHTAVCDSRPTGAMVVLVALQVSVLETYLPPVFRSPEPVVPPQMIISSPVQTAVCACRAEGALVIVVAVQASLAGSYLPPVLKELLKKSCPPQMSI